MRDPIKELPILIERNKIAIIEAKKAGNLVVTAYLQGRIEIYEEWLKSIQQ